MDNETFLSCLPNPGNNQNQLPLYSQLMPSMPVPPALAIPGSPKLFHKSQVHQPPVSPSKQRVYTSQNSGPPFVPSSPLSPQMPTPNSDNDSSRNSSSAMGTDSVTISFSNLSSDSSNEFNRSCMGSDVLSHSLNITSPSCNMASLSSNITSLSSSMTSPMSMSVSVPSTPNPSSNRVLGNGRRFRSAVRLVMNEKRATSHYKQYKYNASDLVSHGKFCSLKSKF